MMKSNSYDLAIPSDYAIEELANEDLLMELDYTEFMVDDYQFSDGLSKFNCTKTEGFDIKICSSPYFWGSLGILYKTATVNESQVINEQFSIIVMNT